MNVRILFLCAWFCAWGLLPAGAQLAERIYRTDHRIDTAKARELSFELDNISFFKDNEYAGKFTKGYSLPGLWAQPKLVYYPLKNIKLEAGLHLLVYQGANKYPSMAYQDIATWKGDQYQRGVHLLPYFRAQMALSRRVNIVLGNIYGAANHRLIAPLYNPELNLTCDPEAGLQVLYDGRVLDLDVWVNWQSFIFRDDTHQEAFTVGLSSRVKYNDPSSRFHFYTPWQGVIQHRGGEIDTIYQHSVQTLMNGAIGVGSVWNTGHRWVKRVNVELDAATYYQQAGVIWPYEGGYGLYARASAEIADFRVTGAYWTCRDFISLFGNPFFGAASLVEKGATFDRPKLLYLGLEYSRQFARGFSLGIDVDLFHHLSDRLTDAAGATVPTGSATSFSAGVYMRVNPSFLLKRF